jgi:hypothetical protein
MKLNEFLLAEFNREVDRSRRALEQVPEGKYDWKPHEKSMIFGYLADMVATIPSWIAMQVTRTTSTSHRRLVVDEAEPKKTARRWCRRSTNRRLTRARHSRRPPTST